MRDSLSQTLVLLLDSDGLLGNFLLLTASFGNLTIEFLALLRETSKLRLKLLVVSLLLLDVLCTCLKLFFPLLDECLHALNLRLKDVLLVQLLLFVFAVQVLL